MKEPTRIQIHVALPYRHEPAADPRVAEKLSRGWRVVGLQRLTDRDALVTLEETSGAPVSRGS